jgi:hypothetical protein
MFIRFVCAADPGREPVVTGPFLTLGKLREGGRLEPHEIVWAEQVEEWFEEHLPVPPFRASNFPERALCWFFGGRNEALSRMWELVAVLRHKQLPMQVLRTAYPGKILYVDDFQVVAQLPRLRAKRRLVTRRRAI